MADHGHGTTLTGGTTGAIGEILSISVSGQKRDSIDVSSMDSTSKCREFIPGMIDAGEITFSVNFDKSASGVADRLQTAFLAGTDESWTIAFSGSAATFACNGFITDLSYNTEFEGKSTQDITIKLTGVPVFTDLAA